MESNVMKMKSALVAASTCLKVCCWEDGINMAGVESIKKEIDDAIAIPLRNCDVGTADEQMERHRTYCNDPEMMCGRSGSLACRKCFAKWAQMPYESEVTDEN